MRFVARHFSLEQIDGATVFALADRTGLPGDPPPDTYVILQFGEEDDQDRELGLTGLHIESSEGLSGYGLVERLAYEGGAVSIRCSQGREIYATIAAEGFCEDAIKTAVERCNRANGRHGEEATK